MLSATSCQNDDDICISGEATPRLKMKFKALSTGKLKTMDSLYVDVDYPEGTKNVITAAKADSALVSLRVDDSSFTDIYVGTSKKGSRSKFRVSYTTTSQYVSPACGIKKNYEAVSYQLLKANPVLQLEGNQTQISDEKKTAVYLDF